ncbi:DUF6455 family protein [Sagittula sp. SSi028]|uniref:DUF6455 family protein n=1 Tax=Sagittula sp. SSi028 TaxID=3400636 RepID=UPI003AF4C56B
MMDPDRIKRHAALVDRSAAAMGVALDDAIARGALRVDELGDAVLRCTGCSQPGYCSDMMDLCANTVPAFCRNRDLLQRLAAERAS